MNKVKNKCSYFKWKSLALPRVIAGILENYQTPNGIEIPPALVTYTGFDQIK